MSFINQSSADKAKEYISAEHPELVFVKNVPVGSRITSTYTFSEKYIKELESGVLSQALETIRTRVDSFGVAEPVLRRVGTDRILLQMPGISDVEKVKKLVGKVARLEFRLIPQPSAQATIETVTLEDRDNTPVKVEAEALMSGDAIENARASIVNGQAEVTLSFTSSGKREFRRITSENVGRLLAIVLDGVVYSSPRINEAIPNGVASITGGFTVEEAQQLAVVLKAGALPASLKIAEERTVGPSLGKESIQRGVLAIILGFVLISLFMVVYYKRSGVIALASLFLNIVLVLALLSFFGATLTLPGLAGLALTVGMAVDSNVIIFERIREELLGGTAVRSAVRAGFDKATSALVDTNVTGIISGLILYYFGTGPIRGFAVTVTIGMITTLFCAVFAARLAFDYFTIGKSDERLSI